MEKRFINLAVTFLSVAALLSCDKDDDKPKFQEERPLQGYINEAGFSESDTLIDSDNYEFGFTFIPKVNGKISRVTVKLPDAQTDLRVTIWDVETETVLKTETIATVAAHTETSKSIMPLDLVKGKEYMITFNTDDWYERFKAGYLEITYPITVGNIDVTGYGYFEGTEQTFPTDFQNDYYAGDLNFTFQQTE